MEEEGRLLRWLEGRGKGLGNRVEDREGKGGWRQDKAVGAGPGGGEDRVAEGEGKEGRGWTGWQVGRERPGRDGTWRDLWADREGEWGWRWDLPKQGSGWEG